MGLMVSAHPERLVDGRYEIIPGFRVLYWRFFGMMGFLGDFGREGDGSALSGGRTIPLGSHPYDPFMTSESIADTRQILWVPVRGLLDFDYDAPFPNASVGLEGKQGDPSPHREDAEAEPEMTFRRFFTPRFFSELDRLAASGADRVVIFFAETRRGGTGR